MRTRMRGNDPRGVFEIAKKCNRAIKCGITVLEHCTADKRNEPGLNVSMYIDVKKNQ